MNPGPVRGNIQIPIRPEQELRHGEVVTLRVIKLLSDSKWAVAVRGKVYPAFSELALQPGSTLRARVALAGGKLLLAVTEEVPDAVRAALGAQGLPTDGEAEVVARALARSGLPILADTIQKVKALLSRSGLGAEKGARAAATLVDKGIDPASPGARTLLPVLAFGEKGGEDPRRYRGKKLPDTPGALPELLGTLVAAPADRPSVLQAYNHIRGKAQAWVVIPFVFGEGEQRVAGTFKVLFDPFLSRAVAFTLAMEDIAFHLPLQGKGKALAVFCHDERTRRAAARGLDSLRAKFHNMGLEVDDIVNDGNAFDGFSPAEEGVSLPGVDTVVG
jgi:hypothetical protein